jgi:hypothetical protein
MQAQLVSYRLVSGGQLCVIRSAHFDLLLRVARGQLKSSSLLLRHISALLEVVIRASQTGNCNTSTPHNKALHPTATAPFATFVPHFALCASAAGELGRWLRRATLVRMLQ